MSFAFWCPFCRGRTRQPTARVPVRRSAIGGSNPRNSIGRPRRCAERRPEGDKRGVSEGCPGSCDHRTDSRPQYVANNPGGYGGIERSDYRSNCRCHPRASTPSRRRRSASRAAGSKSCPAAGRVLPRHEPEPGGGLLAQRRARQLRDRAERRLRRVQAEAEILVGVGREDVGRLVPVRIPAGADLRAALVLAQADRGHEIHERRAESVLVMCGPTAAG